MLTDLLPSLSRWLQDSQLVPIIVLMVALVLLMSSMRRRQQLIKKRQSAPLPPAPRSDASGSTQAIRRDLEDLLVELQDLSRRISAEIDTRFVKLESAMRDADRRIAVLNRLSRQLAPPYPSEDGRGTAGNVGEAGQPDGAQGESSRTGADLRHTVIYELADAGFTPVEIARELGRTPGEVELILNLRRQSQAKP